MLAGDLQAHIETGIGHHWVGTDEHQSCLGQIADETQRARVDKLKAMTPAKIAPLAVALGSDAGKEVSGQIFAVRNNEIYLMGQSRPIRSVHTAEGWNPEAVVNTAFPAFKGSFYPLDRSLDVFSWDPI